MRERQEKLGAIQSEQQRLSQVAQYEQQRAMEAQLASQQEALFAALPEWKELLQYTRCWFNMPQVKQGLDCLRNYRRDYDEKRNVFF